MKPRLSAIAAASIAAASALEWEVARNLVLAPAREFPGPSAEALCLLIAFGTWALLFGVAFLAILSVPRSWHVVAKVAAILVVAYALLTVGQMALVVPFYLLNFLCVAARACEVSLFAEAINIAFSKHAFHAPLPVLLLVVPIFVGFAVVVRKLSFREVLQRSGQNAV